MFILTEGNDKNVSNLKGLKKFELDTINFYMSVKTEIIVNVEEKVDNKLMEYTTEHNLFVFLFL